jgi:isopenicillin-N N-acyltransferase-like protein
VNNKRYFLYKTIFKYILRLIFIPAELILAAFFVLFIFILFKAQINPPYIVEKEIGKRTKIGENHYVLGNNYLKKNDFGVWEMYIEGEPYERGLIYGELAKELVQRQEDVFVAQINQFVPSDIWQQFLKLMIGFFNSDLPKNIPLENQQEIYGISQSFSDDYDYIATKYMRILNYHAAHDIGHALNDYSLVGCTSFSLKGSKTKNHEMVIGRNFDFYVGDEFAEDKLIVFINPTKGYKFASYSWAGFTGVASGLNEKGLSVTINASKSDLPTGSKMPISLLAREILQYASNIEEAVAIAKKRHTFVSETLMIGSAADGKTVLIEKSPNKMGVYDSKSDQLVCANHYQSDVFKNDKINIKNIKESDSKYRYARVKRLLEGNNLFDPSSVIDVLRDQYSENGDSLGMGNPRAVNQLIVHHSVVILPFQSRLYISTNDFQLGRFIGYDLQKTFANRKGMIVDTIAASPFLSSSAYQKFLKFKSIKQQIGAYLMFDKPLNLTDNQLKEFISLNTESYVTYEVLGKFFQKKGQIKKAYYYFGVALTKPLASKQVENELKLLRDKCQVK